MEINYVQHVAFIDQPDRMGPLMRSLARGGTSSEGCLLGPNGSNFFILVYFLTIWTNFDHFSHEKR